MAVLDSSRMTRVLLLLSLVWPLSCLVSAPSERVFKTKKEFPVAVESLKCTERFFLLGFLLKLSDSAAAFNPRVDRAEPVEAL